MAEPGPIAGKPVSAYIAYQHIRQQQKLVEVSQATRQIDSSGGNKKRTKQTLHSSTSKKAKLHDSVASGTIETQPNGSTLGSMKVKKIAEQTNSCMGQNVKKGQRKKQKQEAQAQQQRKPNNSMRKVAEKVTPKPVALSSASPSMEEVSEPADNDSAIDPMVEATEVFNEMIAPLTTEQFFGSYWERKPLLIKRGAPDHYGDWLSTKDVDLILRNCRVMFGEHLDVTSYRDGKRETHNPEGRALASQVWQFYQAGCSLRLLCPQVFHDRVHQKLSILHELFGAFVGANVYLTPPSTQGFAPHWDDIEAFVMQLEGRKHWRVYAPRSPAERLPRESSGNFGPKDRLGQPVIDTVLEPGDLLYMPRGYIHQGRCLDGWHSLHITVSTYQKFAWADLLSEAMAGALERAARQDVEFRRGLPLGLLGFAGAAFSSGGAGLAAGGGRAAQRLQAEEMCRSLLTRLAAHVSLDEAADKLACQQVRDALPPALDPSETARSAHGAGPAWDARRGRVSASADAPPLTGATRVRLLRRGAARLTGSGRLHTSLANTRVFREVEPAFLEVEPQLAPAVAALAAAYPAYLAVDQLPLTDPEDRLGLAVSLYESGLLVTQDVL